MITIGRLSSRADLFVSVMAVGRRLHPDCWRQQFHGGVDDVYGGQQLRFKENTSDNGVVPSL